jgi:hypothetical protein
MARWGFNKTNWTPVAVADTTNMTAAGFMAIQGGSSTQMIDIIDILLSGLAGASAPSQLILARDSTVFAGATSNAVKQAALHPSSAALAAPPLTQDVGSTTLPQRSATLQLLQPAFNAFGGVVRLQLPPEEKITLLGNTASLGEISLSHGAAGTPGLMAASFVFEPY